PQLAIPAHAQGPKASTSFLASLLSFRSAARAGKKKAREDDPPGPFWSRCQPGFSYPGVNMPRPRTREISPGVRQQLGSAVRKFTILAIDETQSSVKGAMAVRLERQ